MVLEETGKILMWGFIWASFAEVLTKVLPIPKKILQIDDKEKRSIKFFRHISCVVSLFYGIITLIMAIVVTLYYGVERAQPIKPLHYPVLYVRNLIWKIQ